MTVRRAIRPFGAAEGGLHSIFTAALTDLTSGLDLDGR